MKQRFTVFDFINIILLTLFGLACFYPFYYIIIYSLSNPLQAIRGIYFLPRNISLANYIQTLSGNNIPHAFFISISRTVLGTFLSVMWTAVYSYGISKQEMIFHKAIYRFMIVSMYFSVGFIPGYVTMLMYGFKNNFLVYIIPGLIGPGGVILMKTFFEQQPISLEESAMLDGAGYFKILFKIVMPICMPMIAAVSVFTAVGQWNTWADNMFYCPDPNLLTIQMLLYNFLAQASARVNVNDADLFKQVKVTPMSIRMTITVIAILPIMMVYPFMQKYFVKGLLIGAIKG